MMAMQDRALWMEVGKHLEQERRRRGWTWRDVGRKAGKHPNHATIRAHERGHIRTTTALSAHLAVFGWRLLDLILVIAQDHPIAPTSDVLALVSAYGETTDAWRAALTDLAHLATSPPHGVPRRSRSTAGGRALTRGTA